MLYADDVCIVSRSAHELANTIRMIIDVCRVFGLTVLEAKTETMCRPAPHTAITTTKEVETAGQRYKQAYFFTYLRGSITKIPDLSMETARRTHAC